MLRLIYLPTAKSIYISMSLTPFSLKGDIAQPVRAFASHARGPGFEPLYLHQKRKTRNFELHPKKCTDKKRLNKKELRFLPVF